MKKLSLFLIILMLLVITSGVSATISATDLIAYYDFDEGTTVLTDLAGGDNNGANTNTSVSPEGLIGNAYYFNNSAYSALTNTGFSTGAFTIAIWIKQNDAGNDVIYSQGTRGVDGVTFDDEGLDPNHELYGFVRDQREYTKIPADTNNWRLLILDYNGAGASYTIDNTNDSRTARGRS